MAKYQHSGKMRREGKHSRVMVFDLLRDIGRRPEWRGNIILIRMQNE